jgi:SRSO17 transposase
MNGTELREARARFRGFVEPLLPLMGRSERRTWAALYIHGLLLEGGRKTAATMAARFGGDEQALQQFVSQSPWDWVPVRQALAERMVEHAGSRPAWLVDDTGFPKQGKHSVGVARQYSGTLGKTGNCQIGASLNYATGDGCFPLDFQLYLPESWASDPVRREEAGIPEEITFQRKWEIALAMIDRARGWGVPRGPVVADAGYGVASEFRAGLRARGLSYSVGITKDVTVWPGRLVRKPPPPHNGRGRPRKPELPPAQSVLAVARSLPEDAWSDVTWRQGSRGPMKGRFAAIRVQPAHDTLQGAEDEPVCWLLIEWPRDQQEPTKYWLSNLSEDSTLTDLVYVAKIRWWVEQNYGQLKDELGLDHFEGRSWRGWHHHVTLTMIAFDFLVMEGYREKKPYWVDPPESAPGTAADALYLDRLLSDVRPTGHPRRYLT